MPYDEPFLLGRGGGLHYIESSPCDPQTPRHEKQKMTWNKSFRARTRGNVTLKSPILSLQEPHSSLLGRLWCSTGGFLLPRVKVRQEASITWCDLFWPKFGQKMPKIISLHDVLEPLKQALLASRDVIISSQICGSNLQKVFTLGDGCWLPKSCHRGLNSNGDFLSLPQGDPTVIQKSDNATPLKPPTPQRIKSKSKVTQTWLSGSPPK